MVIKILPKWPYLALFSAWWTKKSARIYGKLNCGIQGIQRRLGHRWAVIFRFVYSPARRVMFYLFNYRWAWGGWTTKTGVTVGTSWTWRFYTFVYHLVDTAVTFTSWAIAFIYSLYFSEHASLFFDVEEHCRHNQRWCCCYTGNEAPSLGQHPVHHAENQRVHCSGQPCCSLISWTITSQCHLKPSQSLPNDLPKAGGVPWSKFVKGYAVGFIIYIYIYMCVCVCLNMYIELIKEYIYTYIFNYIYIMLNYIVLWLLCSSHLIQQPKSKAHCCSTFTIQIRFAKVMNRTMNTSSNMCVLNPSSENDPNWHGLYIM